MSVMSHCGDGVSVDKDSSMSCLNMLMHLFECPVMQLLLSLQAAVGGTVTVCHPFKLYTGIRQMNAVMMHHALQQHRCQALPPFTFCLCTGGGIPRALLAVL